ncbi:kinase-like protein [Choiromyces venosus 120613-1]|uniref:Kinase-like protein n=1 Tax=Choiromyces venosus 120613-1 TaxID=1336337 RepID=A0A3N4JWP0_9PEZI|nr:kinase-like protein [Choiromyces venosus 120613-1]
METEKSDLVESYRLDTKFLSNGVRHTIYPENSRLRRKEVEEWSNCEILGTGGFSVVQKQRKGSTGHCRAVKMIDKTELPAQLNYSRELSVMGVLAKHRIYFVQFLGWFEGGNTLYIALEYFENGDLGKHLSRPLPQETVQKITKQLLEGLEIMHKEGIAHRDLKPENIFVVSMNPVWVKLGDFGISKRTQGPTPTTLHTQIATPAYAAPEVLAPDSNSETSVYTNAVDIWSLGCVIFELLTGERLFSKETQRFWYSFGKSVFSEDKIKSLSPATSDVGISLIKSMVSTKPGDRPSVLDSLSHPWIANVECETDNQDNRHGQNKLLRTNASNTWPAAPKTNPRNIESQTQAMAMLPTDFLATSDVNPSDTMVCKGKTLATKGRSKTVSSKVTKLFTNLMKSSPKPSPPDHDQSAQSINFNGQIARKINHLDGYNSSSDSITLSPDFPQHRVKSKLDSTLKNKIHQPSHSSSQSSGDEGKKPGVLKRGDTTLVGNLGMFWEDDNSSPQIFKEPHSLGLIPGLDSISNQTPPIRSLNDSANATPMPYPFWKQETPHRPIARDRLGDDSSVGQSDDSESSDGSVDSLDQPMILTHGRKHKQTSLSEVGSLKVGVSRSPKPAFKARPSWRMPKPTKRSSTSHAKSPISTQLDRRHHLSRKDSSSSIDNWFPHPTMSFGPSAIVPTESPELIKSGDKNKINSFDSYLAQDLQTIYNATDHGLRQRIQTGTLTPLFDTN